MGSRDNGRAWSSRAVCMLTAVFAVVAVCVMPGAASAAPGVCTAQTYESWDHNPAKSLNRVTSDCTLHIGPGEIQNRSEYQNTLGGDWNKIRKVVIDDPAHTRLGRDANFIFRYPAAESITGIEGIDTSAAVSMRGIFRSLGSLTSDIDVTDWDTSHVTDMSQAFYETKTSRVKGFDHWDTSHVTAFEYAFYYADFPDSASVLGWDTRSAETMKGMFRDVSGRIPDIRGFDVSNVTVFDEMFCTMSRYGPSAHATGIDVTGWRINTASPVSMERMFGNTHDALTGIEGLDTKAVTDMHYMFDSAMPTRTIDLSRWDTSHVSVFATMFSKADLDGFSGIENFDTGNGTDFSLMFFDVVRSASTTRDLSHWNMSSAKNLESMFRMQNRTEKYMEGTPGIYGITGMENWAITPNTVHFDRIFKTDTGYRPSMDLSRWNTSGATRMNETFYGIDMSGVSGIGEWDVSNIENMDRLFMKTKGTLDISRWNTGSLSSMEYMFANSQLDGFSGIDRIRTSNVESAMGVFDTVNRNTSNPIDLSGWDVGNMENLAAMFRGDDMGSFTGAFDGASPWRTGKARRVGSMFQATKTTKDIDLSGMTGAPIEGTPSMFQNMKGFDHVKGIESFDMSSAVSIGGMFEGTDGSIPMDLSRYDTSHVKDFSTMFHSATRPVSGYSHWDTGSATSMYGMFWEYKGGRVDEDLSGWDTGKVTAMNSMFNRADIRGLRGISSWNISAVDQFNYMFFKAKSDFLDVSGWVVTKPSVSARGMFMSKDIRAYKIGPHMTANIGNYNLFNDSGITNENGCTQIPLVPCHAWASEGFTGRWSTIPSDRDDPSQYWTSTEYLLKADTELTRRIKEGIAGTYVRERRMNLRYDPNPRDGNPVSGIPLPTTLQWPTSPSSDRFPSGTTPSTRDWTFVGWNTKPDGTGTTMSPGDVVPMDGDPEDFQMRVYAQWDRIIRKVRYEDASGGATGLPATADVPSGDGYTVTGTVPSRTGYRLVGWSDDGTDTVRYRPGDRIDLVTGDVTLHAVWRADPSRLPDAGTHLPWVVVAVAAIILAILIVAAAAWMRKTAGGRGRHARRSR